MTQHLRQHPDDRPRARQGVLHGARRRASTRSSPTRTPRASCGTRTSSSWCSPRSTSRPSPTSRSSTPRRTRRRSSRSAATRARTSTRSLEAGLANGGSEPRPAQDYGFMYSRDLEDPDGNSLEFLYMDPAAAEQGPEAYMAEQAPGLSGLPQLRAVLRGHDGRRADRRAVGDAHRPRPARRPSPLHRPQAGTAQDPHEHPLHAAQGAAGGRCRAPRPAHELRAGLRAHRLRARSSSRSCSRSGGGDSRRWASRAPTTSSRRTR